MFGILFFFTWTNRWSHTISSLPWSSWWNEMYEVLVCNKLTKLINNSNGGHVVPVVDRVHDGAHDIETFPLRNDIIFNIV